VIYKRLHEHQFLKEGLGLFKVIVADALVYSKTNGSKLRMLLVHIVMLNLESFLRGGP